jgi:hypothetical protein
MAKRRQQQRLLLFTIFALAAGAALPAAAAIDYNPKTVDWAAVLDACAAAVRYERRLGSFCLRSAFHDAGSLTPQCATTPTAECGGADGSLLRSATEQEHQNNRGELFAANTARFVLPIAKQYGASVADTLYVCSLAAPAILSYAASWPIGAPRRYVRSHPVLRNALAAGFRVGRLDREPGPGNNPSHLPAETLTLREFADWFSSRGVDLEDAAALLGVHALLRPQGCSIDGRADPRTGLPISCNPLTGSGGGPPSNPASYPIARNSCPQVAMLRWSNEWFNDMCGTNGEGAAVITDTNQPASKVPGDPGFRDQVANAVCGYRTTAFRADAIQRQITGNYVTPPSGPGPKIIAWACENKPIGTPGCRANPNLFPFTQNDAHLGDACRAGALLPPAAPASAATLASAPSSEEGKALMQSATLNPAVDEDVALVRELHASFSEYTGGRAGLDQWNVDFARAYSKMSELGALWSEDWFVPNFFECPKGQWTHERSNSNNNQMCRRRCGKGSTNPVADCPDKCMCSTAPRAMQTVVVPATGPVTVAP